MKPKIIAVVGPTASGKTILGIGLAKRFDGEIISADSRQIYRDMNIGTAKPNSLEMAVVPHYLIDIKNPNEDYTVSEYKADALAVINDVLHRGHLPVLVGGTGLYIKSVLENLDIPNIEANTALRAELEKEIAERGLDSVVQKLLAVDPDAAHVLDLNNPRRVIRALEVALATGQPFTTQQKKNDPLFDALVIGLNPTAEILRQRIDERVDQMFAEGFVDEVKMVIEKYGTDAAAFDAIGYRDVIDYLESAHSLDETIATIKLDTWHYAKRQITWFRKDTSIQWITNIDDAIVAVQNFLE